MYEVTDSKGKWLANAPQSSRKDARDAVVAARKAFGGWSGATAYNRGQILYRIAEMLEGRKDQFTREVADAEGLSKAKAAAVVDAAIDRWVWYAGLDGQDRPGGRRREPGGGPVLQPLLPRADGRGHRPGPQESSFLGLISVIAPAIATGNTVIVVASEKSPLPALSLGEVLATSDLPGGVVNILSGATAEIATPWPPTRTSTPSTWRARTTYWRRTWRSRRPTTSSGSSVHSLWITRRPPASTA